MGPRQQELFCRSEAATREHPLLVESGCPLVSTRDDTAVVGLLERMSVIWRAIRLSAGPDSLLRSPSRNAHCLGRQPVCGLGKHAVYLVAILEFASMAAIQAAMASSEGQATAADLGNFAGAGVDIMIGDTRMV